MRIVWTASAVKQLNEIFEYYSAIGASSAGKGIVDQIVFEVEILKSKPPAGADL